MNRQYLPLVIGGICLLVFILILIFAALIKKLRRKTNQKAAVSKANRIAERMEGESVPLFDGASIAKEIASASVAFVNHRLYISNTLVYEPPEQESQMSVYLAGKNVLGVIAGESYDADLLRQVNLIASLLNKTEKNGKKGPDFGSQVIVVCYNQAEVASFAGLSGVVPVLGFSGLIAKLLFYKKSPSNAYSLALLYSAFPDIYLLLCEDEQYCVSSEKGSITYYADDGVKKTYDPKKDDFLYTPYILEALARGGRRG